MASLTQQIANAVCAVNFDDIPQRVVEKAKRSILDCTAAAIAGIDEQTSRVAREYVLEIGGKPEAGVIGSGRKVPVVNAVFANGITSHVLDYDDTSFMMLGHPSCVTWPAALGVGEMKGATGREVLASYVLGVEVACRLGAALTSDTYARGWHNTGTLGTFAATVTAGKILQLDVQQMTYAMGIAASMAAGIKKNFGTSCKSFHAGQAGTNGVKAAILAKKGFTSSIDVLEGKTGLAELLSKSLVSVHLTRRLGKSYAIDHPGLAFKLYPCCAFTHTAIDAAIGIRELHQVDIDDIVGIECHASQGVVDALPYKIPRSNLEAKFSMPFCLAIALERGRVSLLEFTNEVYNEPALKSLMQKVAFVPDNNLTAVKYDNRTVKVNVKLKSGSLLTAQVVKPKGDPDNPLSDDALMAKYRACTARIDNGGKNKGLSNLILHLEKVNNIQELASFLS